MVRLGPPAELHLIGDLRKGDLPGVAPTQPLVGHLHLPAVADFLVEDAELVAKAVADCRHAEGRERLQEAGREPSEPAVAEARLFFLFDQLVEVEPEELDGLPELVDQPRLIRFCINCGPTRNSADR